MCLPSGVHSGFSASSFSNVRRDRVPREKSYSQTSRSEVELFPMIETSTP